MITSPASLLALAASLDAQGDALKAQGDTLKAQAASIRAALEASENQAPSATVTLEEHGRRTGRNARKRREDFSAFERHGFKVHRAGHAAWMDADEYTRAVEAIASKRPASPPSKPSTAANDDSAPDELSPAAIFERAGLVATRNPNPRQRAPKRRAA